MKKKLIFMPLALLGVLALLQFGCSSDEPEDSCEAFTAPKECTTTVEASACCSDETSCYYSFDGKQYPYTEDGKTDLIKVMCPDISAEQTLIIHQLMAAQTKRLIEEIRINEVCQ